MRFLKLSSLTALFFAAPVCAQFGVAGGRARQQGDFQDMQKRAQAAQGAGGSQEDMMKMMGDAFNDPEMLKQYEAAMAEMAKMSPEELQQQMESAMNSLTNDDMLGEIMKQKDEVIKNLEMTGAVTPEELARYKTDDAYFELKMRESFGEMQQMFKNPEYLKAASEAMGNARDAVNNPGQIFEGISQMMNKMSDEEIEQSRLQLLQGDFKNDPFLGKAFEGQDANEILQDAEKFKKAVKEGYQNILKAQGALKDEL